MVLIHLHLTHQVVFKNYLVSKNLLESLFFPLHEALKTFISWHAHAYAEHMWQSGDLWLAVSWALWQWEPTNPKKLETWQLVDQSQVSVDWHGKQQKADRTAGLSKSINPSCPASTGKERGNELQNCWLQGDCNPRILLTKQAVSVLVSFYCYNENTWDWALNKEKKFT